MPAERKIVLGGGFRVGRGAQPVSGPGPKPPVKPMPVSPGPKPGGGVQPKAPPGPKPPSK